MDPGKNIRLDFVPWYFVPFRAYPKRDYLFHLMQIDWKSVQPNATQSEIGVFRIGILGLNLSQFAPKKWKTEPIWMNSSSDLSGMNRIDFGIALIHSDWILFHIFTRAIFGLAVSKPESVNDHWFAVTIHWRQQL